MPVTTRTGRARGPEARRTTAEGSGRGHAGRRPRERQGRGARRRPGQLDRRARREDTSSPNATSTSASPRPTWSASRRAWPRAATSRSSPASPRSSSATRTTRSACWSARPRLNVKFLGSHSGITPGPEGPTAMSLEDFALASSFPQMAVIVPCDAPSMMAAMARRDRVQRAGLRAVEPRSDAAGLRERLPVRAGQGEPAAGRQRRHADRLRPDGRRLRWTRRRCWRRKASRPACSTCTRSSRSTGRRSKPPHGRRARS